MITMTVGGLMVTAGAVVAARPIVDPQGAIALAGWMLLVGGSAEIAVGLRGFSVARTRQEVSLGLLSVSLAVCVILIPPQSALSLTWLLAIWLLTRAAAELVAGVIASRRNSGAAMARLVRSLVDLTLGVIAFIGSLTTALFPGWPLSTVRTVLVLIAASLIASGLLHIGIALSPRGGGAPTG